MRRCPGEGMPQDWAGLRTPKWGTAQILVGPHVTIRPGGVFFVICGARAGEKVFRLVPLLQIKRNKRPLLAGIEKYKIVTTRKRQIEVGS